MVSETYKDFKNSDGSITRSIYEIVNSGVRGKRTLKLVRKYIFKKKIVEIEIIYEVKGFIPSLYDSAKVIPQKSMKILN